MPRTNLYLVIACLLAFRCAASDVVTDALDSSRKDEIEDHHVVQRPSTSRRTQTTPPASAPVLMPFSPANAPFTFPVLQPIATPNANPPTWEPTPPGSCYTSIQRINDDEFQVTDLDVVRNYVLCADTTFSTPFFPPGGLLVRKNMHIYCGEIGGSSDNNCFITGSIGLASIPFSDDPPVVNEGVVIQGISFTDALFAAVILSLPGDFLFQDCVFFDHTQTVGPAILILWGGGPVDAVGTRVLHSYGDKLPISVSRDERMKEWKNIDEISRGLQDETTLSVQFTDCVFKSNSNSPDNDRYALVSIEGDGTKVEFQNTLFQNNNFNVPGVNDVVNGYGVIVQNFGENELSFFSTCWENNRAFGNGLVATYGSELPTVADNFGEGNEVNYTAALECEFVALVDINDATFPNLDCADFDASVCAVTTEPPTTLAPVPPIVPPIATPIATPTAQTAPPFAAPFEAPFAGPVVSPVQEPTPPGACYTSLNRLDDDERAVDDTSVRRDYVLCRNTEFITDVTIGLVRNRPLTLRENMYIWCGEIGGSSANNCNITSGTLLVAFVNNFNPPSLEYNNVRVQGVTFKASAEYAVLIGSLPGDFQFIDCIFIENTMSTAVPILIEFGEDFLGDEGRMLSSSDRYRYASPVRDEYLDRMPNGIGGRKLQTGTLKVDFIDCTFKDNAVSSAFLTLADSIVFITGEKTNVAFERSLFENNNYNIPGINDGGGYGALVEIALNGVLGLSANCFLNNRARGNGLVLSYGGELPEASNNYGDGNEIEYATELECEFIALVDPNGPDFPNIACSDFDASECSITDVTPSPEGPSTPAPATPSPVVQPTEESPTTIVTGPDASPVTAPFRPPTREPSSAPEQGPTLAPIELPSAPAASTPTGIVTGPDASPVTAPFRPPTREPTTLAPEQGPTLAPIAITPPTTIVTGPDAAPVEPQVLPRPTNSPEQGPSLPPADVPSTIFTPAMTPSDITPSMFTPSMFSPVELTPSIRAPAMGDAGPTFRYPTFSSPSIEPPVSIRFPTAPSSPYVEKPSAPSGVESPTFRSPTSPITPYVEKPSAQSDVEGPTLVFPISLFCGGVDFERPIFSCHEENCPSCNFVPLPASTRTCEDLTAWYCELYCCSDCETFYGEAFECAQELVGVSGCSNNCNIAADATVDIDPFNVMFVGDFELNESTEITIISAINSLFPPYLMSEMGNVLDGIDLDIKFINTNGARALQSGSSTARIQVSGELELEADDQDELIFWTSERVTDIVKSFFTGSSLEKLMRTLQDSGLPMDDITTQDGTTGSIVANEGEATDEGTNGNSDSNGDSGSEGTEGGSSNMMAMITVAVCAGFGCLIIAAAVYTIGCRRRKRRHRYSTREMASFADSDTPNLRSGQDELPDCNASVAASHVSFPDVFNGGEGGDYQGKEPIVQWNSNAAHAHGDHYDDRLDDVLDDEWDNDSSKAVHYKPKRKKKRRHHRHKDPEAAKAAEWARNVRKHVAPLSAPQPYDGKSNDEEEIHFYR